MRLPAIAIGGCSCNVMGAMETFGATAEAAIAAFGVPREEWPVVIARLDPPAR